MLKSAAMQTLRFARESMLSEISKLYSQRLDDVALIAEETRSAEARFSFSVELTLDSPAVLMVSMRFVKQHRYQTRTVIQNPDQLDAFTAGVD